jgi:acetyltransferase-like isoleucine patch superfamily enzyme
LAPLNPEVIDKVRRLRRLVDPRLPLLMLRRSVGHVLEVVREFERTIQPEVDARAAFVATRDRLVAPTLRNVHMGQGTSFGRRGRLFVRANAPGKAYGTIAVGRHVRVGERALIEVFSGNTVSIGDFTTVGDGCVFLGDVQIGRHCLFSSNIYISSGDHDAMVTPTWLIHDQDARMSRDPDWSTTHNWPVTIDDDVWMGWGAFVKKGVHVGRGAIVGAHAVVSHDVPPYSIQAGCPAREIGRRLAFTPPAAIDARLERDRIYLYGGFLLRQDDLPAPGGGVLSRDRSRVVAQGGTFQRLRLETRGNGQALVLSVAVNGTPVADVSLASTLATFDVAIPPGTCERSLGGLLGGYNVIDFEASPPRDPDDPAAFELLSLQLS